MIVIEYVETYTAVEVDHIEKEEEVEEKVVLFPVISWGKNRNSPNQFSLKIFQAGPSFASRVNERRDLRGKYNMILIRSLFTK